MCSNNMAASWITIVRDGSLLSVSSGRIKCLCTPSPYLGEVVNDVVWSRNPYVTVSFILFAPSTTFLETTTEKMTKETEDA